MNALRLVLFAVVACGLAFVALRAPARAAAETCTVSGSVAFGTFDVFTGAATISGSISGDCKKGSGSLPSIAITLGNGNDLQASGNRAMKCTTCTGAFAADILQYQLYTTAALSTSWIGATAVNAANPCPCGNTDTPWGPITIFGQIFAAVAGGINDSAVGSYSDSITATINY